MHCTKISPDFECQGQRLKVKVTRDRKGKTVESFPLTLHSKECAVGRGTQQTATDDTIAWSPRGDGLTAVHADGGYAGGKISACCLVVLFRRFLRAAAYTVSKPDPATFQTRKPSLEVAPTSSAAF